MSKEKINRFIIWFNTFFLFSGFQMFLVLFYRIGQPELSRFFSIPLRILLVISMIYYLINNRGNILNRKLNFFILLIFTILYIFKIVVSEINAYKNPELSRNWFEYIFYFVSYCVLTYFFYSSINYKKQFKSIIQPIILSGFLFGIVTIFAYFPYIISGTMGRISYLKYETGEDTINPLSLAYSSVLTLTSIVFLFLFSPTKINNRSKFYYLLVIFVSLLMFSIGSSRGALLTIFMVILTLIFYTKRSIKLYLISAVAVIIPIFILVNNSVGGDLFERSTATIEDGGDSIRKNLRLEALEEFEKHPFFGGQIEVSHTYPHNILIEILMATGVVGFFIFIIFLLRHLIKIINLTKINVFNLYILLLFLNGFIIYSFSGSIWGAILIFFPLGLINSLEYRK